MLKKLTAAEWWDGRTGTLIWDDIKKFPCLLTLGYFLWIPEGVNEVLWEAVYCERSGAKCFWFAAHFKCAENASEFRKRTAFKPMVHEFQCEKHLESLFKIRKKSSHLQWFRFCSCDMGFVCPSSLWETTFSRSLIIILFGLCSLVGADSKPG